MAESFEHGYTPGIFPITPMTIEVRECATLGTNFADVYLNGELWALEINREVAVDLATRPFGYGFAFADVARLRTGAIERFYLLKTSTEGGVDYALTLPPGHDNPAGPCECGAWHTPEDYQ